MSFIGLRNNTKGQFLSEFVLGIPFFFIAVFGAFEICGYAIRREYFESHLRENLISLRSTSFSGSDEAVVKNVKRILSSHLGDVELEIGLETVPSFVQNNPFRKKRFYSIVRLRAVKKLPFIFPLITRCFMADPLSLKKDTLGIVERSGLGEFK